ncbi:hypothetical protein [Geminicoccus roseus]|uniref:hypothetical protein n=1 Tax=Geminicoccus roseus TaxID=404900 RepID=UPI00040AD0CE|nr:hypothetical protein [Geminicoccus roseus]
MNNKTNEPRRYRVIWVDGLGDVLAAAQADLLTDIEWKIRDAIAEWRFRPGTRIVVEATPHEDDRFHLQNFAEDEMAAARAFWR